MGGAVTAATGGAIAGAAGLSMSTVATGAAFGNAMYFGDAYGGGQFLTDVLAGGILGGVAGGVAGWIKNMRAAKTGAPRIDPWGFRSAGKGQGVDPSKLGKAFPETGQAVFPDGVDPLTGQPFKGGTYDVPFSGMEYLDEGVRSTPQPFAGGANGGSNIAVHFGKTENQIYHAFRHTDALGLDRSLVQSTIQNHFKTVSSQVVAGRPFNQIIKIGGQRIQYSAFKFSDGTFNIGRIHGIK